MINARHNTEKRVIKGGRKGRRENKRRSRTPMMVINICAYSPSLYPADLSIYLAIISSISLPPCLLVHLSTYGYNNPDIYLYLYLFISPSLTLSICTIVYLFINSTYIFKFLFAYFCLSFFSTVTIFLSTHQSTHIHTLIYNQMYVYIYISIKIYVYM